MWGSRRRGRLRERGEFDVGGGMSSTRRDGRRRRHSRDPWTRRAAKAAMWRRRAVLVLVAVCWLRGTRGPERGECEIEKTAAAIKTSPTRDAASSGAATCARCPGLSNRPIPGTQPRSETQPENDRWDLTRRLNKRERDSTRDNKWRGTQSKLRFSGSWHGPPIQKMPPK